MIKHLTFDRSVIFVTLIISLVGAVPNLARWLSDKEEIAITNWGEPEFRLDGEFFYLRVSAEILGVSEKPFLVSRVQATTDMGSSSPKVWLENASNGVRQRVNLPMLIQEGERAIAQLELGFAVTQNYQAEFIDALELYGHQPDQLTRGWGGLEIELVGEPAERVFAATFGGPTKSLVRYRTWNPCNAEEARGRGATTQCVTLNLRSKGDEVLTFESRVGYEVI